MITHFQLNNKHSQNLFLSISSWI